MDVLVCGAAGNFLVPADKLSANGFRTVIEIDLLGSFNASRAAVDQLKATRGTIIYISAGMAYMPHAYQVHVGAAKAGIDMMMKNLALEWGPHGIRVNSIVPGPIEGTEGAKRLTSPEAHAAFVETVPLRRMGTADDIGQTAVFLASPWLPTSPAASSCATADRICPVRHPSTPVRTGCYRRSRAIERARRTHEPAPRRGLAGQFVLSIAGASRPIARRRSGSRSTLRRLAEHQRAAPERVCDPLCELHLPGRVLRRVAKGLDVDSVRHASCFSSWDLGAEPAPGRGSPSTG